MLMKCAPPLNCIAEKPAVYSQSVKLVNRENKNGNATKIIKNNKLGAIKAYPVISVLSWFTIPRCFLVLDLMGTSLGI